MKYFKLFINNYFILSVDGKDFFLSWFIDILLVIFEKTFFKNSSGNYSISNIHLEI